jgi:hypothetical protein
VFGGGAWVRSRVSDRTDQCCGNVRKFLAWRAVHRWPEADIGARSFASSYGLAVPVRARRLPLPGKARSGSRLDLVLTEIFASNGIAKAY